MTHLSLFSGIGGIDLAAHWAGFETVQFVERDQFCQKVLAKNFPGVPIHDDVTTFDGSSFSGRLDLVSAGFPCQPHSLAGKRKASGDERDLWGEVVRVLGESQPTWFLGENVAGLFSSESGHFFGRICNDLALLGYRVGWGSWKASDVGACHQRRRVFIVAYSERFRRGAGLRESGGQQPSGGREAWSESEAHGQGISADAKHDGPFAGEIGRSVSPGETVGRLLELEGCSVADAEVRGRHESPITEAREYREPEGAVRGCRCITPDTQIEPRPQADTSADPKRSERHSRSTACRNYGSSYRPLGNPDWRAWDIEPTVCMPDDGISRGLATSQLKALGNAVVPQQVYVLLKEIADYEYGYTS